MRMSTATSVLAAVVLGGVSAQNVTTGALGNASIVSNNPPGAIFTANLPTTAFDKAAFPSGGNVKGSIFAMSSPDGTGVMFQVKFSGLPSEGGPFLYHIHDQPVPADGNCTRTLAHLDPYRRGETPPCDATFPQTCQVGDLSGKYGTVNSDPFTATYTDDFLSTLEGIGAFFGNRSFVLHSADTTRITCANFTVVNAGSSCSCSGTGSSTVTPYTSGATPTALPTPTGSNATATTSPTSVVTAAAAANNPIRMLGVGAAVLAVLL